MTPPLCSKCGARMMYAETQERWNRHYACLACRTVFFHERGQLFICHSPREHVYVWPRLEFYNPEAPPAIIAGPMCRGLL